MGPGDPVGGGAHGADEVFVVKFVVSLFFRKIKFHQIKRLDRSNTRFDCTNTTGALDFEVDRKVWLHHEVRQFRQYRQFKVELSSILGCSLRSVYYLVTVRESEGKGKGFGGFSY